MSGNIGQVVGYNIGQNPEPTLEEAHDAYVKAAMKRSIAHGAFQEDVDAEVKAHRAAVLVQACYREAEAASALQRVAYATATK